jgi:hypothetical protein
MAMDDDGTTQFSAELLQVILLNIARVLVKVVSHWVFGLVERLVEFGKELLLIVNKLAKLFIIVA